MSTRLGMWRLYTIAFVASACSLILEIVASRVLAPHIGVSLYTWTSVIGVVLAGISIGNYLGGRVADRFPSPRTLGITLLMASLTSYGVLGLVAYLPDRTAGLPLVPRILALTTAIFFLPSCVLGMVTPTVVKQALTDLRQTGGTVGKIYAVSTAGSIVGVYLTGFVLIATFGTRVIVLIVATILLFLALLSANLLRRRVAAAVVVIAGVIIAGVTWQPAVRAAAFRMAPLLDSGCIAETNYYCIRVYDQERQGRWVRTLVLDQLVHSYNSLDDPSFLTYGYTRIYAEVAQYLAKTEPRLRTLFIGGGGYTVPRYLEARYPDVSIEVMEIDPGVTRVAHMYLGLAPETRTITYNEDARMAIRHLKYDTYHLVIGDAFNDLSVPYHLTTLEFTRGIRNLLANNGIYLTNIVDKLRGGRFLRAYVHTMQKVFPYVYVLGSDKQVLLRPETQRGPDYRGTYVVAGSLRPIAFDQFAPHVASNSAAPAKPTTVVMPAETMAKWLAERPPEILTDDHVPVDNMLAPLFIERTPVWRLTLPSWLTRLWRQGRGDDR